MMRKFFAITIPFITFSYPLQAQLQNCQVTASATATAMVCSGTPVTVSATAQATLPANQFFDFNQNQLPPGWSTTGGTAYNANTCGPSPDGTPYFWASTAVGTPQIVTADFDICTGGVVQFQMRYAIQGGAVPCEGPDEIDEGVSLEYSLDGGLTWVEFQYFRPDGVILTNNPGFSNLSVANGPTAFTVWATYNIPIPAAAISGSTRFRWVQYFSSGGCCDNWGLDNIGILAGACLTTNLQWSNGMTGVDEFTFSPTADTCFTASLYDDNGTFLCSDDICITVAPQYDTESDRTICSGQSYNFGGTAHNTTGDYTATFASIYGCDSVSTLHLTVTPPLSGTVNATICAGDTYVLGTQSFTTVGAHVVVFTNNNGCDSSVTLNLSHYPVYAETLDTAICAGESFAFGGQHFNTTGTYPITFNTIHNCDSVVTLNLTVIPLPVPVAGNDLVLCSAQAGNLGQAPAANTTYVWTGGGNLSDNTISNPTVSLSTTVPVSETYTLTANFMGCEVTDRVTVDFVPYPVVDIAPTAPQCLTGNSFGFTAGNGFLPGATFAWNFAGGTPAASNVQSPAGVVFGSAGMHSVTVTVSHGTCSTPDQLDVVVHPEYTGTYDTSICAGQAFTFGGQNFSTAGAFPVNFGTVYGCDSVVTLNLTVIPLPVPVAGNDLVLCSAQTGNLGQAPAANTTYVWTGGGNLSDNTISNPTVSLSTTVPVSETYTLTANFMGCEVTDQVTVDFVPYPVVNIVPVAGQCFEGNSFSFTAGNAFLPGAAYAWSFQNASPAGGNTQQASGIRFLAPGEYWGAVQVSYGVCASTDTVAVTVFAHPAAALGAVPREGCVPLTVDFTNTSTSPTPTTAQWTFGNGQGSPVNNPSTVYTEAGQYDVTITVTSTDGCTDSAVYPDYITAYPKPVAGFTATPRTLYQDDGIVHVYDRSSGAVTWLYELTPEGSYIMPDFAHHFYDTGYHSITQTVTSIHGCTDEVTDLVHVLPASVIYIPNAFTPNADDVNSTFGAYGNNINDFHMIIFDRWGSKVFESRDINERWDGKRKGTVMKQDVYAYRILYMNHRGDNKEELGHVTLIR